MNALLGLWTLKQKAKLGSSALKLSSASLSLFPSFPSFVEQEEKENKGKKD